MADSTMETSTHRHMEWETGNMFKADYVWKMTLLVVFTIWIILMNGMLVLGLLKHKDRRNNTYNFHIINLAMTDFLFGCTVLPVRVNMISTNEWGFGIEICQFWIMIDKLLMTVSILIILVIAAEGSVDLAIPDLSPESTLPLWAVLIAGPWIIGAAFIIPFYLLRSDISVAEGMCVAVIEDLEFVIPLVTFIVPAAVVLCLALAIINMLFLQRPPAALMVSEERRRTFRKQATATCVISVVFVLMWSPYGVTEFLSSLKLSNHPSFDYTLWGAYANSAVTPLLWLILPDVRHGFRDLCCCCCCCCKATDLDIPVQPRRDGADMRVIENKYVVSSRLGDLQEEEGQTFV